jgi:hypothetical protein
MTSDEYDKLSDKEKVVKIATLCGWKRCNTSDECYYRGKVDEYGIAEEHSDDFPPDQILPDYLNDLNALHTILMELHPYDRLLIAQYLRYDVFASASQIAKAFVLTMDRE